MLTAHSHSDLSADDHFTKVGNMETGFSHINDGCSVWLEKYNTAGERITDFSTGVAIEVYKDKILAKARKFEDTGRYFGHGIYQIPVPNGGKTLASASITGEFRAGKTLKAKPGGDYDLSDYTFKWIADSKVIESGNAVTVKPQYEYLGKHLFLKMIHKDGSYTVSSTDPPLPVRNFKL